MTKNSAKLRSIKKRCFRKRVSIRNKYRSNLSGGSDAVYVLYLVSGSEHDRVLDICAVSRDKYELLKYATEIPDEVYGQKLKYIDEKDPILHNLYIDRISLISDSTQPHNFEKVNVIQFFENTNQNEILHPEEKLYHITINQRFGLIETISVTDENCSAKKGPISTIGQMDDGQHCIWSGGMTYMFQYQYNVDDRSKTQKKNIADFNKLYGTEFI
jgi:hypothetical protein